MRRKVIALGFFLWLFWVSLLPWGRTQQVDYETQTKNKPLMAFTVAFKSPTTLDSGKVQYQFSNKATVRRFKCWTDTGTVDVNFDLRAESTPDTPGANLLPGDLTCANPPNAAQDVSVPVAAGQLLNLQVNGAAGTPGVVRISVSYKFFQGANQ